MLKSTHATLKLSHDETLQEEKGRIRNDEEKKQKELEDRLRMSTSAREDAEVSRGRLYVCGCDTCSDLSHVTMHS